MKFQAVLCIVFALGSWPAEAGNGKAPVVAPLAQPGQIAPAAMPATTEAIRAVAVVRDGHILANQDP
jgi:hypothetical protein